MRANVHIPYLSATQHQGLQSLPPVRPPHIQLHWHLNNGEFAILNVLHLGGTPPMHTLLPGLSKLVPQTVKAAFINHFVEVHFVRI